VTVDVPALAAFVGGLRPRAGATRVVAIDGPSGSGKTTLAAALAAELGGAAVVHMDAIYPGWDGLEEGSARLVSDVLAPLAAGRPAAIRRWDWDRHEDGPWAPVPAAGDLIVEGAGAAPRAAAAYLSLVIWVEAGPDERRRRAIERDGDVYAPHWERWAAQERVAFVREDTRARADISVVTDPVGVA
jgi:RecA/RadA recombinase